ncbi:casein kinase II b sub [Enterospora canceri]|uniref:Casein kinase II subunit beta n=1 Tax=Enterospora canceri TaxID=1081671 RepID=A0A1Y1S9E2_9MICR|nr:casein kinase II b sub [Enterospora canceri]
MPESESEENEYGDLWIVKFEKLKEHTFLERIPDHFLEDRFNLVNLKEQVDDFPELHRAILDQGPSMDFESECKLYLIIHRRYILFNKNGLNEVFSKVKNKFYGVCSKYGCKEGAMIPVGLSNDFGRAKTKLYCNSCKDIYEPRGYLKKLDGSAWGTTLCPYLLVADPKFFDQVNTKTFKPRLFGFDVEPLDVSSDSSN